eukprot:672259-Pleurochrysis_carterae.AAC.1
MHVHRNLQFVNRAPRGRCGHVDSTRRAGAGVLALIVVAVIVEVVVVLGVDLGVGRDHLGTVGDAVHEGLVIPQ